MRVEVLRHVVGAKASGEGVFVPRGTRGTVVAVYVVPARWRRPERSSVHVRFDRGFVHDECTESVLLAMDADDLSFVGYEETP